MPSAVGDLGDIIRLIHPEEEGTPHNSQYKVTNERSGAEPGKWGTLKLHFHQLHGKGVAVHMVWSQTCPKYVIIVMMMSDTC